MHTLELTAATVDTANGPRLHANWTWAPSALDQRAGRAARPAVVRRPDRYLRPRARRRGRADAVGHRARAAEPARSSTNWSGMYRIADVLPLTPVQQGLLFHANAAEGGDDVYAGQLDISMAGPWIDEDRLRDAAARGGRPASQPGGPLPRSGSASRSQLIPADPDVALAVRRPARRRRCDPADDDRADLRRRAGRGLRPRPPAGVPGRADPHRGTTGTGSC